MALASLHSAESSSAALAAQDRRELVHVPGEGTSGEAAGGITPTRILHALRRRWLVAIPLAAALAALVAWGAETRLTPIYTARTLIHIGSSQPVLLYDDLGGRTDVANHQRTQIATVKSRLVRQAVVRDLAPLDLVALRAKADPVGWLEKEIVADYSVAPEILRVTMKGPDPDELVLMLNAVRDAYLREVLNKDRSERMARLEHLRELAGKHETALKDARGKLTKRTEAHGARDFAELRIKYDGLVNQIQALQTELLLARLGGPESGENPVEEESALDQAALADPVSDGLRKDVLRLEKKIADYERKLVDYKNDSDYKQAAAELETVRAGLARRRDALRPTAREQSRTPRGRAPQPRNAVGADRLVPNRFQIPLLEAEIQKKQQEVAAVGKDLAELDSVRAEIAHHEEQFTLASTRVRQLEVELQAPPRGSVLEDAVIVEAPKADRVLKFVVAPAAAAFLAVIGFVAWLDLRRGQINGSEDLTAARVRVIGAVPSVRAAVVPAFAPPDQSGPYREYLEFADAIDMTRAVIAPVVAATPGYVLAVTSAVAGEGKTVLAAHLAVRFARSGLRTLLIDADVRRPQIHRLFGLAPAPGLGEWLTGAAERGAVVQSGLVAGLDVIAAGHGDPRTISGLLDLRFPELLSAAKRDYDVIVLDSAPLLSTPEALAVSRTADGVVLSVMRDVSRVSGVLACTERLATVNARLLGAVVTGDAPPKYHTA